MLKAVLIIPTLNGGVVFGSLIKSLDEQTYQVDKKLLIDSSSEDNTVEIAKNAGFVTTSISPSDFNHGRTRQWGVEQVPEADIIIFLTQDAILATSDALERIVSCFNNPEVGIAYGRQLPHANAGPLEAHARLFNYPLVSSLKSLEDISKIGIKAAFSSNSFAAYRRSALLGVGGFPSNTILSEDMYVAAKMLLVGWKVAYCAEAQVYHSHSYTFIQEFKRYFDIGVFQSRESWILKRFGKSEGEGFRFVCSEITYLWNKGFAWRIPEAIIRTAFKLIGYRLGMLEKWIPMPIKCHLSMHVRYWK